MASGKLPEDMPLFPTEAQIGKAVFGPRAGQWTAFAMSEERRGLPQIDPMAGGRYWPAVRAYLDRRAGLRQDSPPAVVNGEENWDESSRGRSRKTARA